MDEAEQCDRLVVLAAGREVASGTVADITRGREVVQLRPADLVDALGMLEEAGLVVVPAGATLRVVGADPVEVQRVLGDRQHDDLQVVPATLEEAFVAAVMAVPGAA
jgi:ABC-2 type transport system ATP-binding protein